MGNLELEILFPLFIFFKSVHKYFIHSVFFFNLDRNIFLLTANGKNRVFVTMPRFQPGNPVTLGYVTKETINGNPVIAPYPDMSWHRDPESCKSNRLVSVYRVQIDKCGRMWVLDNGRYINNNVCPAQILAFDLKTVIFRFRFSIDEIEILMLIVNLHSASCLLLIHDSLSEFTSSLAP